MSLNDEDNQMINLRQKPKLRRDFQKYEEDNDTDDNIIDDNDGTDEGIEADDRPATPAIGTLGRGTPRPSLTSSRPTSPLSTDQSNSGISDQINWCFPHLPWAPKVTLKEMNEYIAAARNKYLDYSFKHNERYFFFKQTLWFFDFC